MNSEFRLGDRLSTIRTAPGLTEQVHRAILDEICDGLLPPGAHLVQEQLAARFGVSRQPVQQAMALLKADGVVVEVGRRGLQVAPLDLEQMRHHYEIRGALDALAARSAARRVAGDASLARKMATRGAKIIEAGTAAIGRMSIRDQIPHEEAFHNLIYEFSGNPLLARSAAPHWRYLRRAMGDRLRETAAPREIWQQHRAILDAILAGDQDHAEALAVDHLRRAADMLAETFAQTEKTGKETAA